MGTGYNGELHLRIIREFFENYMFENYIWESYENFKKCLGSYLRIIFENYVENYIRESYENFENYM